MMQYIIFNLKEDAEAFSQKVDTSLGYPKEIFLKAAGENRAELNKTTYATFASPIKKYNAEKYAYPVTDAIRHLVPAETEMKYDLENWYPDAII